MFSTFDLLIVCLSIKWLDSYSAARSKLRQVEETSALDTDRDEDAGRPRRKKRRALSPSDNESSPEKKHKKLQKVEVQKSKRALVPMPPAPVIG
jgi:hypothetical protein